MTRDVGSEFFMFEISEQVKIPKLMGAHQAVLVHNN